MITDIKHRIKSETEKIFPELVEIRREIHKHPELAYEEYRTSRLISEYLKALGLDVQEGVAKTGVVAHLKGERKSERSKVVALRADIDALPMPEETTHHFRSTVEGKMHACGHDAHTAIMLGVAKILSTLKNDFSGTVKFIFQPSEEKLPGGAKPMLDEGVFENPKPDVVFGQHCIPQVPVGKLGFYSGAMMAASDELYFTIRGIGGHGSAPHRAKDPIVATVQLISALQTIVSRNMPPKEAVVVSICAINGGSATNIIPNEVKLMGTLRTMNEDLRKDAWQRLEEITHYTAKAMGVEAELEIRKGYPVLINDKSVTEFAMACSRDYLGEENTIVPEPIMGAEDFAYFLQACNGTFWQLGVGNEAKGIVHNIHSTRFDIDEEALAIGAGFTSYLTYNYLLTNHD
jgi:amidohydrolase